MTDRTVKVSLVAEVSGYLAGMDKARAASSKMSDEAKKKFESQAAAMDKVGKAAFAMGAVAAAGVAIAVKKFMDFDAQMSLVKTLSHATADEMKNLTDEALNAGQKIGFSAVQVADAETELVKAGISVKDIMGGALVGSLNLAAAGQIDVGKATEIASIAMTQFKLSGKDVPHIADLLAAGADKALGGVDDLGNALNSGGLVAAQFGLTLDDTVGTLAAFAQAGLMGETAGTDLRQMLLKLAAPSKESASTMKDLGISLYDASGQFVGITNLAGQLKDKMSVLDPATRNAALATIFGSRAIAGANVLYQEGAKGIQGWIDKVNDAGFAQQQARGKMDNLAGDIKKLGAAFDTDLIKAGSSANVVLRDMTQGITGLVGLVGGLPGPVMATGLALTGVAAAIGLVGGGALVVVPKIAAMKAAMATLNITSGSLVRGLIGGVGVAAALTVVTTALSHVNDTAALTKGQISQLDAAINGMDMKKLNALFNGAANGSHSGAAGVSGFKDALTSLTSGDFFQNKTANLAVGNAIDGITGNIFNLSGDLRKFQAQFTEMGTQLAQVAETDFGAANAQFQKYVDAAGGGRQATEQLLKVMPDYKDELIKLAASAGAATDDQSILNLAMGKGDTALQLMSSSAKDNSAALDALSGTAQSADVDISALAKTIKGFGSATLDSRSAARAFQAAIDDATASVKKNGKTLDIGTEAGRANQAALDGIVSSATDMSSTILTATGSQEKASAAIQHGRDALIKAAEQMGYTKAQAGKLADQLGLIPGNIPIAVKLTGGSAAISTIQRIRNELASIPESRTVSVNVVSNGVNGGSSFGAIARASGGILPGAPSVKDNMLIHAASGEYVVNSRQTAANRRVLDYINAGGVVRGYANGGLVQPTYVRAPQQQYMSAPMVQQTPASQTSLTFNTFNPVSRDPIADIRREGQDAAAAMGLGL